MCEIVCISSGLIRENESHQQGNIVECQPDGYIWGPAYELFDKYSKPGLSVEDAIKYANISEVP